MEQKQDQGDLIASLRKEHDVIKKQLLNRGLTFDTPKRSILKNIPWGYREKLKSPDDPEKEIKGMPARLWLIRGLYLSTMDAMAEIRLQVKISVVKFNGDDPVRYKNQMIRDNTRLMAKLVAFAVLNSKWKIKLFGNLLAGYLADRMTASKLHNICLVIEEMEDALSFINSTVLVAGADRTTMPKTEEIEESPTITGAKQ